ncbi:hypothetical protein OsJ_29543 [Oryza sativa Japonica Group]|uniref:Uncharacterized protein n=1 Tax=Oryza sativa subsp. japonica TaxID=39947 RepID=A3BZB3_ORYSJ|nr:hypothetical protein OsJ_29543 [Oryza sativa Japonica Group]
MARLVARLVVPYTGSSSPSAPRRLSSSKRSELASLPSSSSSTSARLRTSSSTLRRTTDVSAPGQKRTDLRSDALVFDVVVAAADMHGGCGTGGDAGGRGTAVGALGFLGRRDEENSALTTHANVAGDGPDDDGGGGGTVPLGRSLAPGKHGRLFFFFFFGLLFGGAAAAAAAAASTSSGCCGGGWLWRLRCVVDSVSVVDADEQVKLL